MFETSCYIQGVSERDGHILFLLCSQRWWEGEALSPILDYLRIKCKISKKCLWTKPAQKQLKEWISLTGLENFRFVWLSRTAAQYSKAPVNLYWYTRHNFPEKSHFELRWCNTLIEKVVLGFVTVSQDENCCTEEPWRTGLVSDCKGCSEHGSTADFIKVLLQINYGDKYKFKITFVQI